MSDTIETRFVSANGLTFEVDMYGSGDRLALCLHGFPESKFSWRHQLPLLAQLGYRVWAPNLRGYGKSSRPKGVRAYHMDHLVEDVQGLIAASGARETVLLAHDWGGLIGWMCAIRKIPTLSHYIVCNAPHPTRFGDVLRTDRAQFKRSWYMFFFQLPFIPEWLLRRRMAEPIGRAFTGMAVDKSRFPAEITDHYRANALLPGALTAMINYYRAAFRAGRKVMMPQPAKVDIPTLMIWGEADTALGKSCAEGTDAYVKELTLRFLPGVSHWVQQEAPEAVNVMIEAWLTGKPVPEAAAIVKSATV